jgi:hypothetical protein
MSHPTRLAVLLFVSTACSQASAPLVEKPTIASSADAPRGLDAGAPPDADALPAQAVDALPAPAVDALPAAPDLAERVLPWRDAPLPAADVAQHPPACAPTDWLAKFLAYRTRFRGDGTAANAGFVAIGDGPGMSMPATARNPLTDCGNSWQLTGCRDAPIANANGIYSWGDGTVWMGWYLRALVAEYLALAALKVDTAQTLSDIGYALDALDRLDAAAETFFGKPPALDGFFLRDDVTQDLLWSDAAHTQLRFARSDGLRGYGCVTSGGSCGTVSTADGYFISQDQFIEMLPGLAMVAKLLPETATANGRPVAARAKEFTHRVTSYLKGHDWKIVDPNGQSPPNAWGGSAAPYSTQIAQAANFITGNAFGVADYAVPGSAGEALALAEGAAVWAGVDIAWSLETLNNQSMILSLASVTDAWSEDKLVARATAWDAPVFAMIAAALHGRALPGGLSRTHLESMLTSAPCGGPCHGLPGCAEAPGWKGEHRFKSPEDRDGDVYGIDGEFGGLDYILLWGLYVHLSSGRTQMAWDAPPTACAGTSGLDQLMSGAARTYDPWDACNRRDFGRTFCGRPFADWLDGAYAGRARIFFAGGELTCSGRDACRLQPQSGSGSDGEDLFLGSAGDDTFSGGGGDDCLYGFGGNDTLAGGRGSDEIHGGPGADTLCGESCGVTELDGEPDVIFGDDGDDDLAGGPGSDILHGGDGNDRIRGGAGWDRLDGEAGDDDLDGELGDDIVVGGPGNDRLLGGFGDDMLRGGDGRDKLDGGEGDDTLFGGDGDDFLMGGAGKDSLWGENGSDRLCGGCGEDQLYGGWDSGVDECRGEAATICLTSTSNSINECEVSLDGVLGAAKCLDAAFDAW